MPWLPHPSTRRIAFWQLGFRPFFLLGALFAALSILAWALFLGGIPLHLGYLDPITWHAHEMVYGFATAIIAGFLLTAIQNWTGIRGLYGKKLKILVTIWALGRVLLLLSTRSHALFAWADLLFYPAMGAFLFPYFEDPELKIERVFFLYFTLFFTGNLLVHLESLGMAPGLGRRGVLLGVHTILLVIIFIGGRVIPFFTESSLAKSQPKVRKFIEPSSHVTAWLFLITRFFLESGPIVAFVSFGAGIVHLIRLQGWQVPRVRRIPLIWVLHLAYLWIVIGFILSGFAALGFLPSPVATHAFTVGGIGLMILGMIARVSLGHTGRRLHPSIPTVVAFVLLALAAFIRVFVPWLAPGRALLGYEVSSALWIASFGLFIWVYWRFLLFQRADG